MTIEEARKIAVLIATADNNCEVCVTNLAAEANKLFPEFEWLTSLEDWECKVSVDLRVVEVA